MKNQSESVSVAALDPTVASIFVPGLTFLPFQSSVMPIVVVVQPATGITYQMRFDRERVPKLGARFDEQDSLGFRYDRMLQGEASAAAGRHRPLSQALNELRTRNNG